MNIKIRFLCFLFFFLYKQQNKIILFSILDLILIMAEDVNKQNNTNRKYTTSTTVNILNDPQLMNIHEQHECQRYELFRRYEQLLPNKIISPIRTQSTCSSASSIEPTNIECYKPQLTTIEDNALCDISEDLQIITEQRVPDLSVLDGEPMEFTNGSNRFAEIISCFSIKILFRHEILLYYQ